MFKKLNFLFLFALLLLPSFVFAGTNSGNDPLACSKPAGFSCPSATPYYNQADKGCYSMEYMLNLKLNANNAGHVFSCTTANNHGCKMTYDDATKAACESEGKSFSVCNDTCSQGCASGKRSVPTYLNTLHKILNPSAADKTGCIDIWSLSQDSSQTIAAILGLTPLAPMCDNDGNQETANNEFCDDGSGGTDLTPDTGDCQNCRWYGTQPSAAACGDGNLSHDEGRGGYSRGLYG